jgi:4-hydroxy-2-oxoheptanedioate aldolase
MSLLGTRLRNHETLFGVFAKTNDPFFIEVIGKAGFDFVILDSEHGPNSPRDLYPLILASRASALEPVVRVGMLSEIEITRALDLGVSGIQVPQLTTVDDARKLANWSRFWPNGSRGVCRFVRAADFSLRPRSEYFEQANAVTVIGMVEGVAGIQSLDEILQVNGIDVLFIGPYDLSQALGLVGEVENPRVLKEIEAIVAKCKAHDRVVGTFVDSLATAKRYKDLGVQFLAFSVDVGIFADACRKIIDDLRAL